MGLLVKKTLYFSAVSRRAAILGLGVAALTFPAVVWAMKRGPGEMKPEKVGTVNRLRGRALAVLDALPRVLKVGAPVYIGDVLSTGPDTRLEIRMQDDGLFQLGARTSFTIIDYTFGSGGAALRLLFGAINGITGKLASAEGLVIETDVATIGIRGTKFWIGDIDGLMHVAHWSGGGLEHSTRLFS